MGYKNYWGRRVLAAWDGAVWGFRAGWGPEGAELRQNLRILHGYGLAYPDEVANGL